MVTVATTVPGVLDGLAVQLRARPALNGVAVHAFDLGQWSEPEAVCLQRAGVTGTAWRGLGRLDWVEQCQLSGYVFSELAEHTDAAAAAAHDRCKTLWGEVAGQVRDDPNIGGALSIATGIRIPLRAANHNWDTWLAEAEGAAVVRARVSFTFVWEASS